MVRWHHRCKVVDAVAHVCCVFFRMLGQGAKSGLKLFVFSSFGCPNRPWDKLGTIGTRFWRVAVTVAYNGFAGNLSKRLSHGWGVELAKSGELKNDPFWSLVVGSLKNVQGDIRG